MPFRSLSIKIYILSTIAFHASHEQFAPSRLLDLAVMAEKSGFTAIHSSDHFHPWSKRQGHSGFSFAWLGAAMHATTLPFSAVCAPGQRYHPAIVAQAIATLSEMFPGRFDVELGSGEAINEGITAEQWPEKEKRNERLLECVNIIRSLLNGDEVSHRGHVNVENARLYSLPSKNPRLMLAAVSGDTAGWGASWADGLITTGGDPGDTGEKIKAFKENGGEGKPVFVQLSFSYAHSASEAIEGAWEQWRSNLVGPEKLADVSSVAEFDRLSENISRDEVAEKVKIITSPRQLTEWVNDFCNLRPERIILHNVNSNQEVFVRECGPKL